MKKPYKYNIMANIGCPECGGPLKANVVARKSETPVCFSCYRLAHRVRTARECRVNPALRGHKRSLKVPIRVKQTAMCVKEEA
jgi:hypothetical protein